MEESTREIELPHPVARWLWARGRSLRRALRHRRLLALLTFLAALIGFVASVITIGIWWQDSPAPLPALRIVELVPDPVGSDQHCERIRLQNLGEVPIDLRGWRVRDASHATWALDLLGVLEPGRSALFWRDGRGMSLNNTGDTVELLDSHGQVLQTIRYPKVLEGEAVLVTSSEEVQTRFIEPHSATEPVPAGSPKEPERCRSEPVTSLKRSSPSF